MRRRDMNYSDYEGTIMDRCWSVHASFGIDLDELRSESSVIYMKAVQRWNPRRSSFNTFLYKLLNNELHTFALKYIRSPLLEEEWNPDMCIGRWSSPYQRMVWVELIEALSDDARYVANLFLNGPGGTLRLKGSESPSQIRGKLRKHLMSDLGWTNYRASQTINELKLAMN